MSKKLTLNDVQGFVKDRATCISTEYKSNKQKLQFICHKCGSLFWQAPTKAKVGSVNPCCLVNKKKDLSWLESYGVAKKIKLLDASYVNGSYKHNWECLKCGNTFNQSYFNLRDIKNPCPKCNPRKTYSLPHIEGLAKERNYLLLDILPKRRLKMKCNLCTQDFSISLNNFINKKQGCPSCFGIRIITLEEIRKEAESKNCEFLDNTYTDMDAMYNFRCNKCGQIWDQTYNSFERLYRGCSKCKGFKSYGELQLKKFLDEVTNKKWITTKKLIRGKSKHLEIDAFNPDYKYVFEYCGVYYHSELFKSSRYHYNKYTLCKDKGYTLITIFEDEWIHTPDKVKNRIRSLLGLNSRVFYARKLILKEINKSEAISFYKNYHLFNAPGNISVSFGLYAGEELLAAMSLGKHHRTITEKEICLNRLCYKEDVAIKGGAERLFKASINWSAHNGFLSIISWSDNRWSSGNLYRRLKFKMTKELPPDYSYVFLSKVIRKSKQALKKTPEERRSGLSEHQLRLNQKLYRIYDCGKIRWDYLI